MNLSGCGDEFCLDRISMNKARAFNPFLCAKNDKLLEPVAEAPRNLSTVDLRDRNAAVP